MTTSTHFDIAATRHASSNASFNNSRAAFQARSTLLGKRDAGDAAIGWWDSTSTCSAAWTRSKAYQQMSCSTTA